MFARVEPSPAKQSNQEGVSKHTFATSLFKYVHLLLTLGGIYSGSRNNRELSCKETCYTGLKKASFVIILCVNLGEASLFCYALYDRVLKEQSVTRLMTFFMVAVAGIVLSLLASSTLPGGLMKLEEALQRYETQYGLSINVGVWLRRIKFTTVVFPGCAIEGFLQHIVYILNVSSDVATTVLWQGYLIVCIFFSCFLLQEFKAISNEFEELAKSTSSEVESRFEKLIDHHESAVDVLNYTNTCVCHYGSFGLFFTIPIMCYFLYAHLSKTISTEDLMFLIMCFGMAVFMVGVRLFMEACVSKAAHGPLGHVWKLRKKIVSEQGIKDLNVFLSRLTGDSIGYSIYGFITINMPTLLAIFGTFATYLIVVIQFKPIDTLSQCEMFMRNLTGCVTA